MLIEGRTTTAISPVILNLLVGQTACFPIEKMRSVRSIASELGLIHARRFETSSDAKNRTITVKRVS